MSPAAGLEAEVRQRLALIAELEPSVQAWAHFDAAAVQAQLARLQTLSEVQAQSMPLLGFSVGLKDIIDTADMPTENGTVLHHGRQPSADAELATRLREAGALIMGKTVTTELATYAPGKTRNPHDLQRTPGGSSSGSAAAVACGMVRAAVGSQTNGSTIRPAAYCGVVGFKPSQALIPRRGVLVQSPTFDTVGLFACTVDDVMLLMSALCSLAVTPPSDASDIALRWWPTPYWSRVSSEDQTVLLKAAQQLGAQPWPGDIPPPVDSVVALHGQIMEAEIATSFTDEYARGAAQLSASLRGQIERGRATSPAALAHAKEQLGAWRKALDAAWPIEEGVPVGLLMPAATGTAPAGLGATGDPVMCTWATAMDLPAVNLPGLLGSGGLPLGIQLVGPRGSDASLLSQARVLHQRLQARAC